MIDGFAVYDGPQVAPDTALAGGGRGRRSPRRRRKLTASRRDCPSPPWELDRGRAGRGESRARAVPAAVGGRHARTEGRREAADPAASVPKEAAARLTDAFARAAGLSAVAQAMASSREAQAARLTGWPAGQLLGGRRDPMRALRAAGARPPRPRPARRSSPRWTTRSRRSPTRWAATCPSRGQAACARRPGATRAWCRRRSPAPCRPWSAGRRSGPPGWWRLVTAWQWLLTVLAAAGVAALRGDRGGPARPATTRAGSARSR